MRLARHVKLPVAMNNINVTSRILLSTLLTTSLAATACVELDESELGGTEEELIGTDPSDPSDPGDPPPPPPPPTTVTYLTLRGLSVDARLDDEPLTLKAELYGTISYTNLRTGQRTVRNLGHWGNPLDRASVAWHSADGPAPKNVNTEFGSIPGGVSWRYTETMAFTYAKLCASNTYASCSTAFGYGPHVMGVPALAGDRVQISFEFRDYDRSGADDLFCRGTGGATVAVEPGGLRYLILDDQPQGMSPQPRISGDHCNLWLERWF